MVPPFPPELGDPAHQKPLHHKGTQSPNFTGSSWCPVDRPISYSSPQWMIRRAERASGVAVVMASRQDCVMLAGGLFPVRW